MKRIITLLLCLILLGCNTRKEIPDYSGTYGLVRIDSESDPISEEEMNELRKLGYDVVLSIYTDGTCQLDSFGKITEMTYSAEKMTMSSGDETIDFSFEDNLLIISETNQTLVFTKKQ